MEDSSLRRSRVPRRTARRLRLNDLCRMFLCPRTTRRLTALRLNPQRGINGNNKGVSAGFGGHGNQCPGRKWLFHRGGHPSAILVPVDSVPTQASLILAMYAAARTIPLALFALGAIYKQATPVLLLLGSLAGVMQLLDAGIGLYEHDLGKCAGPLFIAALQFFVVYLLHKSVRIAPQTARG